MTMQLVQRVELTGTQTSITFNSIPQDATDLLVLVSARNATTTDDEMLIYPNGSSANLSHRLLRGSGSSAVSASVSRFYISQSGYTANTFSSGSIYIPNYAGTTAKSMSIESANENNATEAYMGIQATLWNSTAAITSLTLQVLGGTLAIGTSATLYKITKGSDGTTTVS